MTNYEEALFELGSGNPPGKTKHHHWPNVPRLCSHLFHPSFTEGCELLIALAAAGANTTASSACCLVFSSKDEDEGLVRNSGQHLRGKVDGDAVRNWDWQTISVSSIVVAVAAAILLPIGL